MKNIIKMEEFTYEKLKKNVDEFNKKILEEENSFIRRVYPWDTKMPVKDYRTYNSLVLDREKNYETTDYFDQLEKEMEYYFIEALLFLKLPLLSFECTHMDDMSVYGIFNCEKQYIQVALFPHDREIYYPLMSEGTTNKEYNIFVLFHEIGHYWHMYWHNNHFERYRKKYKEFDCQTEEEVIEYNKQNLEKHANNIARILYKRIYKNV